MGVPDKYGSSTDSRRGFHTLILMHQSGVTAHPAVHYVWNGETGYMYINLQKVLVQEQVSTRERTTIH